MTIIFHLFNTIFSNKKAPFFSENFPKLEKLYENTDSNFSNFVFKQLEFWLNEFGIGTKIILQSTLNIDAKKSDLVYDMCVSVNADHYLSGAMGAGYLNEDKFRKAGIKITYQDYHCAEYPQLWGGPFIPRLSVVDFWMNTKDYSLIINK